MKNKFDNALEAIDFLTRCFAKDTVEFRGSILHVKKNALGLGYLGLIDFIRKSKIIVSWK